MTGGIDLAAEWAGFESVGQCEFADYPTKVLEKHWPDVPRWRDVRDVTGESIRERGIKEITLLSGGFPCQPHSVAGKRKASDDERDLWPEYRRVISEVTPRWVLGENVPGLLTSEFGQFFRGILRDLSELGYSVGWATYGANAVGAFHQRSRLFIVAHANDRRSQGMLQEHRDTSKADEKSSIKMASHGFDGALYKGRIWPRQTRIRRVAHGIPHRMERFKCIGNSVPPQQYYPILQAIADIERSNHHEKINQR